MWKYTENSIGIYLVKQTNKKNHKLQHLNTLNSISTESLCSTFFMGNNSTNEFPLNIGTRKSFSDSLLSHRSPVRSLGQKQVKVLSCSSQVPPPSHGFGWHGLIWPEKQALLHKTDKNTGCPSYSCYSIQISTLYDAAVGPSFSMMLEWPFYL